MEFRTDTTTDALAPADGSEPVAVAPTPGPSTARARNVVAWIAWGAATVLLAAILAGLHLWSSYSFDARQRELRAQVELAADERSDLSVDVQVATATTTSAGQVVETAAGALVDAAARTAVIEASAAVAEQVDAAEEVLAVELPAVPAKPAWTWELLGSYGDLDAKMERAAAARTDAAVVGEDLALVGERLDEAGLALFATVAPAAKAIEAAHVSARTGDVLDFRDAAKAAQDQTRLGSDAAVAFSTYASEAAALSQSSKAELAEKAGALYDTRLEIEAYARSIAGGIVLDFDWAPVVNGHGGWWSMGGTATWTTDRGGYSTITLSNSVAEQWPSADARALVTHEVGHAITSKCWSKFEHESSAANEEWATAWAISMGHTAEGNGVQAYGHPSQKMIDLAATCR